jgi:hypothetical protein
MPGPPPGNPAIPCQVQSLNGTQYGYNYAELLIEANPYSNCTPPGSVEVVYYYNGQIQVGPFGGVGSVNTWGISDVSQGNLLGGYFNACSLARGCTAWTTGVFGECGGCRTPPQMACQARRGQNED